MEGMRNLVGEDGAEILGDFFGPLAKWTLRLLNRLIANHPDANGIIACVFGAALHEKRRLSPFQILADGQRFDNVAAMQSSALMVCRLSLLMLVMVVGKFDWKLVLAFHVGIMGYNLGQVNQRNALAFQGALAFLYICDITATPPTFSSRVLLHLLGLLLVFILKAKFSENFTHPALWICSFSICFYTPLWVDMCVCSALLAYFCRDGTRDVAPGLLFASIHWGILHVLVYLSAGGFWGFCGNLLIYLGFLVILHTDDGNMINMMAPLPLVCALLTCFFVPFWAGACVISAIVCNFALANNNIKAIVWWAVSFSALHALSYAFSRDLSVLFICLPGMYFSYGCIL